YVMFFFSSRRRHTRSKRDWSSDVCSSDLIEDGSYMRLTNVTLGYNLSEEVLEKLGLTKARLFVSGKNLITITGYSGIDPELTSSSNNPLVKGWEFLSVPHTKSFNIGLNLSF